MQYAPAHEVEVVPGGTLAGIVGESRFAVNSLHGQAVRRLAEGLKGLPGVKVEPPQTNLIFIDLDPALASGAVERLRAAGVLCTGLYRLRLATHLDVSAADIDAAIERFRAAIHPRA